MLFINNAPLPAPCALTLQQAPPQPFRVSAAWRGLTGGQMRQVLGPAQGPFTLTCHDPAQNALRGFGAALAQSRAQATQDGLWDLDITFQEEAI